LGSNLRTERLKSLISDSRMGRLWSTRAWSVRRWLAVMVAILISRGLKGLAGLRLVAAFEPTDGHHPLVALGWRDG
jgi:hypothetical protein